MMNEDLQKKEKRFIVRKFVMAKSAEEAIKKEKDHLPDEVFIDNEWSKDKEFSSAIGFTLKNNYNIE